MVTREDDLWLICLVVPQPERVVFTSAEEMSIVPRDCNMANRVGVALEKADLGNLKVAGVECILGHKFVLRADQESAGFASNARAAVSNVRALICLYGLVFDDVHVVLEADD